ncbi:hypothetical protein BGX34_002156, partial [Mortierella sp. NVP85]
MASTSPSSTLYPSAARSMPTECLERIVYHVSQDHRVLSTLMQVNSTLFRIATPYLYREPFRFRCGDEFQLDWDTETWTRHLRDVRRAKLLLLYLSCTETVQTLMFRRLGKDKGKGVTKGRLSDASSTSTAIPTTTRHKYLSKTQQPESTSGGQSSIASQQDNHVADLGSDPRHSHHYSKPPQPIVRIPEQLEKLLRSQLVCEGPHNGAHTTSRSLRRMSLVSFTSKMDNSNHHCPAGCVPKPHTVNYLDYIEHLDLDSFLDTSIQVLFSSSAAALSGLRATSMVTLGSSHHHHHHHHHHTGKEDVHATERVFIERVLLRSTTQHLTTLSLSVATFARLQLDLMEHILNPPGSSPSSLTSTPLSATLTKEKNQAGIRTGAPLSQLSRLNISGLHAELKPKVLRAIRWFLRRHVVVYPGVLKALSFEGTGDATVNRRRQRNRNVIGVEPVLPGVVHFNNQYTGHDAIDDVEDQLETAAESLDSSGNSSGGGVGGVGIVGGGGGLLVDATGHVTNLLSGPHAHNGATEAVPADFHSQYYLLSRNPDESCELDFMSIVKELKGQLELLDFSRWSWSEITQQALDMIPTDQLLTLRFHPRTRIISPHGPMFLKKCRMLKVLDIQAFDSAMLDVDSDNIDLESLTLAPTTAASSSDTLTKRISLGSLSLTGNVPSVLLAAQDAIRLMGKSLDTIDLTAHLDSYLSDQEMRRLMDWNNSLSTSSIPCLTTLQLHGHLAMNFNVPQLLELCPTLRRFGLTIKSYTSSSFTRTENARVLPRFMVTPDQDSRKSCLRQCFLATVRGATTSAASKAAAAAVSAVTPKYHLKALELEGPWILTERDVDQIGLQITGLVYLNLVGCRFYPNKRSESEDDNDEERKTRLEHDDESSPVIGLVERVQDTLKTLRIHRRGLEGKPRRDSAEFTPHTPAVSSSSSSSTSTSTTAASKSMSTLSSFHSSSSSSSLGSTMEETPAEPVLAFKKRFPNVSLQIREKQHENSFVLAPPVDTLRRIHHRPTSRSRTSTLFSDLLGQPSTPHRLHEFPGQSSL